MMSERLMVQGITTDGEASGLMVTERQRDDVSLNGNSKQLNNLFLNSWHYPILPQQVSLKQLVSKSNIPVGCASSYGIILADSNVRTMLCSFFYTARATSAKSCEAEMPMILLGVGK